MIYKLEFLKWKRSGQFWIISGLFIVSAVISMTMMYYLKDIMNIMGDEPAEIVIADATWKSLMESYLKNAAQLMLLVVAYLVSLNCTLGNSESLNLFYKTNGKSTVRVYLPKLVISLFITILSLIIGGITAAYMDWAFFDKLNFVYVADAVLLQIIGFMVFIAMSLAIAVWTNKPFVSAITVELIVLLSALFSNVKSFTKWSPTCLLQATDVLSKGINWELYKHSLLIGFIIFVACAVAATLRPLKQYTGRDSQ